MKRYRFRLAQVQRIREVQEGMAAAELAATRVAEALAVAAAEARVEAIAARPRPAGATSGDALARARTMWDAELRSLSEGRERVRTRHTETEAARTGWIAARSRVRALELLDDRQRAEHSLAADRDEDKRVDDLVVGRFARSVDHGSATA
jgi:flagellar export protein FliJ